MKDVKQLEKNLKIVVELYKRINKDAIIKNLKESISNNLFSYKEMTPDEIFNQRKNKFLKIGRNKGFITDTENLSSLKINDNLNKLFLQKKTLLILGSFIIIAVLSFLIFL